MNARLALSSLLISVAVVAVYHLLVSPGPARSGDGGPDPAIASMEARLRALEDAAGRAPALDGRGGDDRRSQLERRLAALEARAHPAASAAPGTDPSGGSSAPATPSEDAVARGQAIIEAARAKARQENVARATSHHRDRVRRLAPDAAEADLDAAASLLAEYTTALRELYDGTDVREATPAAREALERRHEGLRADLQRRLRAHLPDDVVEQLTRERVQNR